MSLVNCKECKKEVSSSASKCPHCGIKNPGTKTKDVLVGALVIIFVIGAVARCAPSSSTSENPATPAPQQSNAEKDAQCKADLQCWGDRAIVGAGSYCARQVERLGKYSHRWTDGTLEPKFSRFSWLDKEKGLLRMYGDKIEFQNGFGAYQPHRYRCDYNPATHEVIDVSAEPGRLQ